MALMLCVMFSVTSCIHASRWHPDGQDHAYANHSVALEWTGDDGLSISFKRAILKAIKSNSLFELSYYGSAEIVINNSTNVLPIFAKNNEIVGFRYHVIAYRRVSSNDGLVNSVNIDGKCKNAALDKCASHILDVVREKLKITVPDLLPDDP